MDKVLRGVIEQSAIGFEGLVNRLGGDMVNLFRIGLEKAYSNNMVECPVVLTLVSGAGATSLSWWSDSASESETGASTS